MNAKDLLDKIKRYPIAVGCGLGVIIFAVLIFYRSPRLADLESKSESLSRDLQRINTNLRNAAELPEQLEDIRTLSRALPSRLMNHQREGESLGYFYSFKSRGDIERIVVSMGEVDEKKTPEGLAKLPGFIAIPFSVQVGGSWHQVTDFLYSLTHEHYFVRVTDMSALSAQSEVGLQLNLYVLGEKQK